MSGYRRVLLKLSGESFAGSGGLGNLTISNWFRDKGFGMGRYMGSIGSALREGVMMNLSATMIILVSFVLMALISLFVWELWFERRNKWEAANGRRLNG